MVRRLVIFLIRKKLGLKVYECFRFKNQSNESVLYYFTKTELKKIRGYSPEMDWGIPRLKFDGPIRVYISGCSINWLLDDNCKVEKMGFDATWVD